MMKIEGIQGLGGKAKGWMILLEADPKTYQEVGMSAIKFFTDKGHHGIVLTSTPKSKLLGLYESWGLDLKKLTVVDIKGSVANLENQFEVANVVIAVNEVLRTQKKQQKRFVFVNSINEMLQSHEPENVLKFLHGILTRVRIKEINGVLLSTHNLIYEKVKSELEQLCDSVIRI